MPSATLTRSTFGTLLKHSKFASFDPRIAQVYTTHGGDAHRGHWGLKRPLPLRRRGAYVTVKNVDTPEHQTEWNSAEPQALWIKNWDELKLTPQQPNSFDLPEEHLDSDYVPQTEDSQHWRPPYITNLETMSRKEFAQYLDKIRAYRNAFLKQRTPREQANGMTSYQLSNLSKSSTPWHDLVAIQLSRQRRSNPRSREIEDLPHPSGGLSYAHYSPLQTSLMTKEHRGRLADEWKGKDRNMLGYVASFAGMTGSVAKKNVGQGRPVIWDDPDQTGEVMVKPQKAVVKSRPMVVGERQGLKAAYVELDLRVWDERSHSRSNPHPPGSRAYITAEPPRTLHEMAMQGAMKRAGAKKMTMMRHGETLDLLKQAMARTRK